MEILLVRVQISTTTLEISEEVSKNAIGNRTIILFRQTLYRPLRVHVLLEGILVYTCSLMLYLQ